MTQEILNAVRLIHKDTGEKWLFLYDSTPDVIRAICNEASDRHSNMTFSDADDLIETIAELEDRYPLNQDLEEDYED